MNTYNPNLLRWFALVCGGLTVIVTNSGGDLWWFAVVCGGLRWFVVVCGGLWWFAVDCGGLSFSHTTPKQGVND